MPKKRTLKPFFRKGQVDDKPSEAELSRIQLFVAQRQAAFEHAQRREALYEIRRRANARMSGKGHRECARRRRQMGQHG